MQTSSRALAGVSSAVRAAATAPPAMHRPGRDLQVVSGGLFHSQLVFGAVSLADSGAVDSPAPLSPAPLVAPGSPELVSLGTPGSAAEE